MAKGDDGSFEEATRAQPVAAGKPRSDRHAVLLGLVAGCAIVLTALRLARRTGQT